MINITLKIITLIEDYLKKIGILTAGGDCPGLNAIIRSVVISANLIFMVFGKIEIITVLLLVKKFIFKG